MSPAKRYARKHAKAKQRQRLSARERHERRQRRAQRAIEALRQARNDLGVPDDLVLEIAGRLRAQKNGLAKSSASCFRRSLGVEAPMS
jgi:hypothetical protein